jgi:hypothetical protein
MLQVENVQADLYATRVAKMSSIIDHLSYNDDLKFEDLNDAITRFEELIFSLDNMDKQSQEDYLAKLPAEKKNLLADWYCKWETELETHYANRILSGDATDAQDYLLYDRFSHLITKELNLVNYDFNRLLFIGSGPFPITAILLHHFTGKRIDCLEKFSQSAEISRAVLKKLGLEEKVIVHEGDGGSFDTKEYDVVLNALLAKPKWQIMKNIRRNGNPNCKVLCRTSYGLRQLLYEATASNAIHGFKVEGEQLATYNDTISTLLLSNKECTLAKVKLQWLNRIDTTQRKRLADMMNDIIVADNCNGFVTLIREDNYYFDSLEKDVRAGLKHLLVLEMDGKYLGQLIVNRYYHDTYSHRAEVSALMLSKSVRGKDVSLRIAEALLDKSKILGLQYITIDVRHGSRVEMLWKHLGFVEYGKLPCYAIADGQMHQGSFMYQKVEQLEHLLRRRINALYQ